MGYLFMLWRVVRAFERYVKLQHYRAAGNGLMELALRVPQAIEQMVGGDAMDAGRDRFVAALPFLLRSASAWIR